MKGATMITTNTNSLEHLTETTSTRLTNLAESLKGLALACSGKAKPDHQHIVGHLWLAAEAAETSAREIDEAIDP